MAIDKGNTACTTGASKRVYDVFVGNPNSGLSNPLSGTQDDMVKALCWAVAQTMDEVTQNGKAYITTSQGGLQTSSASGNPTDPPASEQELDIR